MKNVIFIAPPLAGKGTVSNMLALNNGYFHLSVGDVIREKAKSDNSLALKLEKGELISDDVINRLVLDYFDHDSTIFDGYPRTLGQAEFLLSHINKDHFKVIFLNASKEVLLSRVSSRRQCTKCGRVFNVLVDKIDNNMCPHCKCALFIRSDDNKESFENRYNEYLKETYPLIKFFKEKNMLYEIVPPVKRSDLYNEVLKTLGD